MSSRRLLIPLIASLVLPAATSCDKGGADAGKVKALEDRLAKFENGASAPALEQRIKKLEDDNAKYKDMLAAIKVNWDRQAAQQKEEEANEPAEDATFAVDVTGNEIEGPKTALVTIIEAWDFG